MPKQSKRTKEAIIEAATRLFDKQGYKETTIEQIINEAGCSKGTFYYHFTGKEELSISLTKSMDMRFEEWYAATSPDTPAIDKLLQLAEYVYDYTEREFDSESYAATYAYYLNPKSGDTFDSPNRFYNTIVRNIMKEGQNKKELRNDISFVELGKMYNIVLRGVLYDWCISRGSYSVKELGMRAMKIFLPGFISK
ncbi:TetR/AcrR family transcriptional regulator [Lachnospiraceae bacterium 62-35]